jgi:hypothetical protein
MHRHRLLSCALALATSTFLALPAGAGVIINEIDYDQPSTDAAEWIELHNPNAVPQPLVGLDLVLVNGNGCSEYFRFSLDAITIPAGGHVVIGNHPCATSNGGFPLTNAIQNGAPDDVYIQRRSDLSVVDGVEYEQAGASACGYAATDAIDDSVEPAGSIQRCGSGWTFSANGTPCADNGCPISVDGTSFGRVKAQYR